jgi:hypothetical protein
MRFSVAFHHGGQFVRDWMICYKGGERNIFKLKDDDDWGYGEMCGLVEEDLKISKGYKPILTMCEWIRTYLMNMISTIKSKLCK